MKKPLERSPAFYVRRRKYGLYPLIIVALILFLFAALGGGGPTKADTRGKESGTGYLTTLPEGKRSTITPSKSEALEEKSTLEKKKEALQRAQASLEDNFDFATLDKKSEIAEKAVPSPKDNPKALTEGKTDKAPEKKNTEGEIERRQTDRRTGELLIPSRGHSPRAVPSSSPMGSLTSSSLSSNALPSPALGAETKAPLRTGFYGGTHGSAPSPENTASSALPKNLSLRAMIHGSQTITQGAMVKLRLLESIPLAGQTIPANTFLFAQSGFSGNRVTLTVHSLRVGGKIIPLDFNAYDLDGALGLAAPDLEDNALGNEVASEVPGAVSTGIGIIDRTTSALVRKKTRKQITLPSDYTLLLRHEEE